MRLKFEPHNPPRIPETFRQSQGYSEDPEDFRGTRPAHELMQEKLAFKRAPRHVWGIYADHQGKIRKLFMSEKKRRLCPSVRALSLAKTHPSKIVAISRRADKSPIDFAEHGIAAKPVHILQTFRSTKKNQQKSAKFIKSGSAGGSPLTRQCLTNTLIEPAARKQLLEQKQTTE